MKIKISVILTLERRSIIASPFYISFHIFIFRNYAVPSVSFAKEELTEEEILQQRMSYYVQFDELLIPWHF